MTIRENSTHTALEVQTSDNSSRRARRQVLGLGLITLSSPVWVKPIINNVVLPAHAQTSTNVCVTDITVGGPLTGNASGAANCADACAAEAADRNAQLCLVTETPTATGTDCACDLDLP